MLGKRKLAKYPDKNDPTLTDMYNVLEKLRAIDSGKLSAPQFSPKDKHIHTRDLISILRQLHDDLDTAVFSAYGWSPTISDDQLLQNLVAGGGSTTNAPPKKNPASSNTSAPTSKIPPAKSRTPSANPSPRPPVLRALRQNPRHTRHRIAPGRSLCPPQIQIQTNSKHFSCQPPPPCIK